MLVRIRVKSTLQPVEGLPAEERSDAIEYACTLKDLYDLTDPDQLREALADSRAYGQRGGEIAGLLRNFADLATDPSLSGGADAITGAICEVG